RFCTAVKDGQIPPQKLIEFAKSNHIRFEKSDSWSSLCKKVYDLINTTK
ncbi:unnamed protein product, partial [marine sediment metagenome]